MSLTYYVEDNLIPNDNSKEIIERFESNTGADVIVFPDVHMKKGALIPNGLIVSSDSYIFPACLGVENCGFTFGKILCSDENLLRNSFEKLAHTLNNKGCTHDISLKEISESFNEYLETDYRNYPVFYEYLGYDTLDDCIELAHILFPNNLMGLAKESLGTLGGGNHFFEIHKITHKNCDFFAEESSYIFMLHTDSVAVGNMIYELYSDLHELNRNNSYREVFRVMKYKYIQKKYFKRVCSYAPEIEDDLPKILFPGNNYQAIEAKTPLGKTLLLAHRLSSIFGEMNRNRIINQWSNICDIPIETIGSHSHDSVMVEKHKGQTKIVHRNGVQKIGNDEFFILPSAMGNYSYIMKNMMNEDAYFSVNHGIGRIQDKHIAREAYKENDTLEELVSKKISLYRVGEGSLAEQNMHAFKNPTVVVNVMEKYGLGQRVAKTHPIAILKG